MGNQSPTTKPPIQTTNEREADFGLVQREKETTITHFKFAALLTRSKQPKGLSARGYWRQILRQGSRLQSPQRTLGADVFSAEFSEATGRSTAS